MFFFGAKNVEDETRGSNEWDLCGEMKLDTHLLNDFDGFFP